MKKAAPKKSKEFYTRDALSRIIALLELIKKLKYPSLNKLADALEYDEGFKRYSRRTLIRDIIYLRDSCQYPIFFDQKKMGYSVDWEKGKEEGFLPKLTKDPTAIAQATKPLPPRAAAAAALPEGALLAENLKWAALKIKGWERFEQTEPVDATHAIGVVYRGCQVLEGLLAHCLSILLQQDVRTDDLAAHGRFEEQIALLKADNEELTKLIRQRVPGALRGKALLSETDRGLLEELRALREGFLGPARPSFKQQQKEIRRLLHILLSGLRAFVESDLARTCAAIEPNKAVLRPD